MEILMSKVEDIALPFGKDEMKVFYCPCVPCMPGKTLAGPVR